jgi:hypothetical protein
MDTAQGELRRFNTHWSGGLAQSGPRIIGEGLQLTRESGRHEWSLLVTLALYVQ